MLESLKKIIKGAIEHWLSSLFTIAVIAVGGRLVWFYRSYLKDWLLSIRYIEMPGWAWILVGVIEIIIVIYFIWGIIEKFGRQNNQKDIVFSLEDWFENGDEFGKPQSNTQYYFNLVEKELNLKRGSSKKYLPRIAWKHRFAFQMGSKTFTLKELTFQNDPTPVFLRNLKPLEDGNKEIIISCDIIDKELCWPKGASKYFLLNSPLSNINFSIEIKDIGGDIVQIIRK